MAARSRAWTVSHRPASPMGQSSETIPSRGSPSIGAACGIRHRSSRSRQRRESRMGPISTDGECLLVGTGSINHRVDAEERIRTSPGGRTTITRIADSPRRRRSSSPSWIRRLSRASNAFPSTITASIAGVRMAASRHQRLDARSSSSGRMKIDRSSNRASTSPGWLRSGFGIPSSPRPVIGAPCEPPIASSRPDTRFQGPGRHRRPIHVMLGDDRPRSSCSFRRR